MAFVTSEQVSALAVEQLRSELVLPMTCLRVGASDLQGPTGGKTILRVPVTREAQVREVPGANLDFTEINETPVEFDLVEVYDGARVNAHQMTMDIVDFGMQVTIGQIEAVARRAERELGDVMNDLPIELEVATDGSDVADQLGQARAILGTNDVGRDARWLAVSPLFEAALTSKVNLSPFDGPLTEGALREGIIGRYRGFNVVPSNRLTGFRAAAYHSSAFAFASVAPEEQFGTVDTSVVIQDDIAMRHVFMLNSANANSHSLLHTFVGAALTDIDRVVALGETPAP